MSDGTIQERLASGAAAGPSRSAGPHETRYLLRSEHPQVEVTWGSRMPAKPDKLKLRKRVEVWPVEFTFKADYDTETREFSYGMMCRDQLIKGDITLNMPQQQLQYRKALPLPNGALLALNASCRLEGQRLRPDFGVALEFGTHSARGDASAVYVQDAGGSSSFDVQQRIKVAKGIMLEVCGNVRLPSPAARYSPGSGQLVLGEGAFHLHVAEINAVVHV